MNLEEILTLQSIDFTPYEIRGAKSGILNAKTTGPVYVSGSYIPSSSSITGDGSFSSDRSSVLNLTFDSPYTTFTTDNLRSGDYFTANTKNFYVKTIQTSNSFTISTEKDGSDATAGFSGSYPISFNLSQREYIVEPDTVSNTSYGNAVFTQNDTTVIGIGTTWLNDLSSGNFIKHDGYQNFYIIKGIINNTTLGLTSPYIGDTTTGAYTAKKWIIGQTEIRYATNNIQYDNQITKWTYDNTSESDKTTSTDATTLADGINLAWTRSLNKSSPDIMDIAVVSNKVFARKTQYETPQFSLPVVPNPEATVEVFINDVKKDRYPLGNKDYILHYSSSPVYEKPPSPENRQIASIMFLDTISNNPGTELTESGQIGITNTAGEQITGILSGSEQILIDSTVQRQYRDYVLETNAGILEIIDSTSTEPIVKYVGLNYSDVIDYGFTVYLNGVKQKVSFPLEADDDVLFQPDTGRLKPQTQDYPGPNDIYEVHYMVEAETITDEIPVIETSTLISTKYYPIKQNSINLTKKTALTDIYGTILSENEDYFVSYLTGRIVLVTALKATDILVIDYTPLSKQVNDLTYDSVWYCTTQDSRLIIKNYAEFEFQLSNPNITPEDLYSVIRIYNETRNMEYDLTGIILNEATIKLSKNSINTSIGLAKTDIVVIDYKNQSETLEYYPVVVNYLNIVEGVETIYIEGTDISSVIVSGTVLNFVQPDSDVQYSFTIDSAFYDGYGTRINLVSSIPEDITNPKIFITDTEIEYKTVPVKADPIIAGSVKINFPGTNISNIFRPGTLIKINDDLYPVSNAAYENSVSSNISTLASKIIPGIKKTIITLNSAVINTCKDSTELSSIGYSDCPVYNEGDTEIIPEKPAVTIMQQPGLIISNTSNNSYDVTVTSSQFIIDNTAFSYATYGILGDLTSALLAAFPSLSMVSYVPQWYSNRLVPTSLSVYKDSDTVFSIYDRLEYHGSDSTIFTDTTNFTLTESGNILLTNPLVGYDRYNLDYMGRQFLGESQVDYSMQYFVNLPAKSKLSASFQYDNLDQFYIQVMDRGEFFETVSIPRIEEESSQLNDNVGQGGDVPGDTATSSSDGGITGTEFRRQDAEIECRVFKTVYDFFSDRLEAFGDEMKAGLGWKLFNNDGMFTDTQQDAAYKVVNRIFPTSDYTNLEPMRVNPITGYFLDLGAIFTNGSTVVTSVGDTYWDQQLGIGDFIGRTDSTKRYQIATIGSSTDMTLVSNFIETSTTDLEDGDSYTASNKFPIYDDDGHLGAKIIGSKYKKFRLDNGDVFNCTVDNIYNLSYTFTNPSDPFLALLFPVSRLTADSVCQLISSLGDSTMITCTQENVLDPTKPYGYRSALVLRTIPPFNKLRMLSGDAVSKLGFIPGTVSYGNLDRTTSSPELLWLIDEVGHLDTELTDATTVYTAGLTNKLDRIDSTNLPIVNDIYTQIVEEMVGILNQGPKLTTEISATGIIIQEPTLPAYTQTHIAHHNAEDASANARLQWAYDSSIYSDWQSRLLDWKWALSFEEYSMDIKGTIDGTATDSTGIGVVPIGGQNTFILEVPSDHDRRFLNALMPDTVFYTPNLVYKDTLSSVPGTWSGWDMTPYPYPDGSYSLNNQLTFRMTDATVLYIQKDKIFTTPTYTTSSNLVFNWTETEGAKNHSFSYITYSTLNSLVAAINTKDGFGASILQTGSYPFGSLEINTGITLSTYPGITIRSGTQSPAFSMVSSDTTNPTYYIDSTAIAIIRTEWPSSIYKYEFLYSGYPTLGDLESDLAQVPYLSITGIFDSTYIYGSLRSASGTISGTVYAILQPIPMLKVYFEQSNMRYSTDTTSVNVLWDDGPNTIIKTFPFTSYQTLSAMKTGLNLITGIDATGNNIYNSDYCEAFRIETGSLDATIYRGLRDCTVAYYTISDQLLTDRLTIATDRSAFDSSRISYLYVRESQIRNNLRDEEILRTQTEGVSGDLYTWANNRFNRRQGCYARLKQIEQQISSNQSALNINKYLNP